MNLADLDLELDDYPSQMEPHTLATPTRSIVPVNPADPARLGYPPTFPIEIAMRTAPVDTICEAYGIGEDEWDLIREDPTFLGDLARAVEMLREEGMSFKVKAKLQAEELLKQSWRMIHDAMTPPNVRADLIKATVRWAGYEPKNTVGGTEVAGSGFHISINFAGERPEPRLVNP